MDKVKELKTDSTLWATLSKLVNLLDFKPDKIIYNLESHFDFNNNVGSLNMLFVDNGHKNKYY